MGKESIQTFNTIQLERQLEELMRTMPTEIKRIGLMSQYYKARFDSLVKEGFTEAQALEIIKARGLD
ncbi:hypothetical protein AWH48_12140 [Domibacillus aminovorans]|uniref:Uncharacterized protein n=1 Tax=Domibacillus aminovorans TaxID=29332 RepID=A0A177KI76_9BACI|nr:hypothetical protein [Domibacillus aminovorans]OAH53100.1 hypothetical protein AWH48_12140 [Domibacillus aminovorans]